MPVSYTHLDVYKRQALFCLLSRFPLDRTAYRDAVRSVTVADAAQAARQVELDTIFFLKGAKV